MGILLPSAAPISMTHIKIRMKISVFYYLQKPRHVEIFNEDYETRLESRLGHTQRTPTTTELEEGGNPREPLQVIVFELTLERTTSRPI